MLAADMAKILRKCARRCEDMAQQLDGWDALHAELLSLRNYLNSIKVQIKSDGIDKGDTAHVDMIDTLLTQYRKGGAS